MNLAGRKDKQEFLFQMRWQLKINAFRQTNIYKISLEIFIHSNNKRFLVVLEYYNWYYAILEYVTPKIQTIWIRVPAYPFQTPYPIPPDPAQTNLIRFIHHLSHHSLLSFYFQGMLSRTSLSFGLCRKSDGPPAGNCLSSAHCLMASKSLHWCSVLKSTNACGFDLSHHTWPRTPVSTWHMSCWRMISRQWAGGC